MTGSELTDAGGLSLQRNAMSGRSERTERSVNAAAVGVDIEALTEWMDRERLGNGAIYDMHLLSGGTQNVMLAFSRSARRFLLRRGPQHLRSTSNSALRREMRLLGALAATDVPHPRLIAACPDETVLDGSAFFLMELIDGFNAVHEVPAPHAQDRALRYRMGLGMVDALSRLARVEYTGIGLGDFGRPTDFLDRQVLRWQCELESYSLHKGYSRPDIPGLADVADWLKCNQPRSSAPGVMHGDFHLGNVMFSRSGPEVVAIVDWEMCTIGDPLLDLGWMLATWPGPGERDDMLGSALARLGGLPDAEHLIGRYEAQSGRDVRDIGWYIVLACFKLGILLEGTYARSCVGLAPADVGWRLHDLALRLFDRAISRITA